MGGGCLWGVPKPAQTAQIGIYWYFIQYIDAFTFMSALPVPVADSAAVWRADALARRRTAAPPQPSFARTAPSAAWAAASRAIGTRNGEQET